MSSVTIADFNSDGKLDVAAANAMAGGVSLFVGNGDGTFQSAQTILLASGLVPLSAVSGDFNGDGNPDLAVAYNQTVQTQPGGIAVLLGNGDGTFQAPVNIALPGPLVQQVIGSGSSAALAVGDLNGDGNLDIVTAIQGVTSNQVAVLLGNGKGAFQSPILTNTNTSPPMIVIADQIGNGKQDLFLADCCGMSEASFLAGNGDGTFQAEIQFGSGPSPVGLASAEFNGDGIADLAIIGQLQTANQGTLAILYDPAKLFPSTDLGARWFDGIFLSVQAGYQLLALAFLAGRQREVLERFTSRAPVCGKVVLPVECFSGTANCVLTVCVSRGGQAQLGPLRKTGLNLLS